MRTKALAVGKVCAAVKAAQKKVLVRRSKKNVVTLGYLEICLEQAFDQIVMRLIS